MSEPPQANAQLTEIVGPGLLANYDQAATSGPVKWTGSSGVYVQERLESFFNANGELNRVMTATLYMDADLPAVIGDTLVYTWRGEQFSRRVQNLTGAELPGVPDYVAAVLEIAGAA